MEGGDQDTSEAEPRGPASFWHGRKGDVISMYLVAESAGCGFSNWRAKEVPGRSSSSEHRWSPGSPSASRHLSGNVGPMGRHNSPKVGQKKKIGVGQHPKMVGHHPKR